MHAKLLIVTTLAALASAIVEERDIAACASAASKFTPLALQVPTAAASLSKFLASQPVTATNPCVFPEVTGSLSDEVTSYFSTLSKFYDDHEKDFQNVISACQDVTAVKEQLAPLTQCTKLSFPTGGAAASGAAASSGGPASTAAAEASGASSVAASATSAATTPDSGNSASRESGMAVVAALIAGIAAFAMS